MLSDVCLVVFSFMVVPSLSNNVLGQSFYSVRFFLGVMPFVLYPWLYISKIILNGMFYSSSRDLLPKDFVVYTYNKEGALISDYPDMQVIYFIPDPTAEFKIIIILKCLLFRYSALLHLTTSRVTFDIAIHELVLGVVGWWGGRCIHVN